MNYFPKNISKTQSSDTGMAVVLILLLLELYTLNIIFVKFAVLVLVITMSFPMFFYPFAFIWFCLSNVLGAIMSKVLLTIVYFLIVFPVGIFRKIIGKDALQIYKFKKNKSSVMKTRNYKFSLKDISSPF